MKSLKNALQINSDVKDNFTSFPVQVMSGKRNLLMNEKVRLGGGVKELCYYVGYILRGLYRMRLQTAEALTDCLMALQNNPLTNDTDVEISQSSIPSLQVP